MPDKQFQVTDEELMAQIASGKREAFELLYERYFDKLVWFAATFVFSEVEAEDLVQDVFLQLIRNPRQFDPARRFSTWIYTLTGNACKSSLRNKQNRGRLMETEVIPFQRDQVEPTSTYDYLQLRSKLNQVFAQLNDKEKTLFVLRFEESLNLTEIAQLMSIPEGSVKSGLYYLLKKIGSSLKTYTYEN